ncbi:MAG: hypothetical protein MJ092_03020 [Lachnospiraceae bacterium]|nr:hypothetical protein [Lachnospiraceae bacterium]
MKRKFLLGLSIIAITIFICACGGTTKTAPQTIPGFSPSGSSVGSAFFVGSSFDGSASSSMDFSGAGVSFTMTNATGFAIESMIVRNSVNEGEVVLVSEKKPFENWEDRNFFCPVVSTENLSAELKKNEEPVEYTMEIQLENGVKYLLHDFPLGKTVKMLAIYERNTGYLIYENLNNHKMISTQEIESVLSKQDMLYAGGTYGEILDPYTGYYQNPYADYDQPPVYVEPDLAALPVQGSKDGCLDGGLFW